MSILIPYAYDEPFSRFRNVFGDTLKKISLNSEFFGWYRSFFTVGPIHMFENVVYSDTEMISMGVPQAVTQFISVPRQ